MRAFGAGLARFFLFFFFNDTATTEIYTLSLHDALPILVDTMGDGRVVREWESPDVASLYAAGAGRVAATRSPYYVPQLSTPEPDSALIRMLDTLGRPIGRLATIRRPATPLLDYVVNAGAVAVGPD